MCIISVAERREDCHAESRNYGRAGDPWHGLPAAVQRALRRPPGTWWSQRHWHSHEDEFVFVLEGELTLIEDGGETVLRAGDCAAFPKDSGNGHHLINRSNVMAVYLEVAPRSP